MTRPRPSPRPRSSRHERSPPRTAHGPRATPPSELPETGSAPDTTAPPAAAPASLPSLHTSTIEVLRPPVEFALGTALTVALLCDAVDRGCCTATLQSTPMAERVYASVGFRD